MSAEDWRLPLTLFAVGLFMFVLGSFLAVSKSSETYHRARRGHSDDERGRAYDWRHLYPTLKSWNYQTWIGANCLMGAVVSAAATLIGMIVR